MEGREKGARRAVKGRGTPVEESVKVRGVRSVAEWWEGVVREEG